MRFLTKDEDTANYLTNRETYQVMKENIIREDVLNVSLAEGTCIKLVLNR